MQKLRRLFGSPFASLYDEAGLTHSLRRGLMFVILGNLSGSLFLNITQGSAIVGLAAELGASDFTFGILMAIPLFGTIIQIPAAIIVNRAGKRKKYMLSYGIVSRVVWILIGIVPYIVPMNPGWLKLWAVIFLVGISSVGGSFINICFTPWLADLLPMRIRGRWIATRDKLASILGIGFGILTALVLDNVPGVTGYAVVFIVGGSFGVLDMLAFIGVKESPVIQGVAQSITTILKQIYNDKKFFRFMLFWTVWMFSISFGGGTFALRYALGPLDLSFLQVTLAVQMAGSLTTVAVISKWGRTIDQYGSKPVLLIACSLQAINPLVLLFSQPGFFLPFLLLHLIGAAFWSAANLACFNMQMSCSPDEGRPTYIAIFSCVTSLFGAFLGVFLGGAFLEWLPEFLHQANITFRGHPPDRYKIAFVTSVILRLITVIVFIPGLHNDKDGGIRELAGDFKDWVIQYSPLKIYRALRRRTSRWL